MPFQSEAQRRYLWANEPEIARDWTDTYGSGIAKALGGRIGFYRGASSSSSSSSGPGPGGQSSDRGGSLSGRGRSAPSGPGPGGQGASGQATQNPGITTPSNTSLGGDRIIDVAQRKKRQDVRALIARQQAEKDYTRQGIMKTGPQLGWAGGAGPNIGNWASGLAGSKIGGGLGSMLLGPWGMLLGSLFGRGVGQRAYKAYQTPEKETMKDIMLGQNTLLSNLFTKPTRGGEGIETVDIGDDLSSIEGQQAKVVGPALIQMRVLEKKKGMSEVGGPKLTPDEERKLNKLKEMDAEETVYKSIIT